MQAQFVFMSLLSHKLRSNSALGLTFTQSRPRICANYFKFECNRKLCPNQPNYVRKKMRIHTYRLIDLLSGDVMTFKSLQIMWANFILRERIRSNCLWIFECYNNCIVCSSSECKVKFEGRIQMTLLLWETKTFHQLTINYKVNHFAKQLLVIEICFYLKILFFLNFYSICGTF